MLLKGLTIEELNECLNYINQTHYDGNIEYNNYPDWKGKFINFTIKVKDSKGAGHRLGHQKTSSGNRRRLACACWHVHRDLMIEIFRRKPDAVLKSALATYNGKEDFESSFEGTYYRNIGSNFDPMYAGEACECEYEQDYS